MIPTSSTVYISVTGIYKYLHLEIVIFYTFNHSSQSILQIPFFINLGKKQPKLKVKSIILGHRIGQQESQCISLFQALPFPCCKTMQWSNDEL